MQCIFHRKGFTLVEIIMTFAVLGVVICPLMTMFVMSCKICNCSDVEYKSMLLAQKYMEEVESMNVIDTDNYPYNYETGFYERDIFNDDGIYETKIRIIPFKNMLYNVEIDVNDSNGLVNSLQSSKIFY
jgi:prepilin-type N-terminal cleavage/methylation domain-containing protein